MISSFAWAPHGTNARDIDHFIRLFGYTPMTAIPAVTVLGGDVMGHPEELGKFQPGYYADCILVDTTDLLADVRIFQDTSKIHGIFINGHKHKLSIAPAPSYRTPEVEEKNGVNVPVKNRNGHASVDGSANGNGHCEDGLTKWSTDVTADNSARLDREMASLFCTGIVRRRLTMLVRHLMSPFVVTGFSGFPDLPRGT